MIYDIFRTVGWVALFPITWALKTIVTWIFGQEIFYRFLRWSSMVEAYIDIMFHPSHMWGYKPSLFSEKTHNRLLRKLQKKPSSFTIPSNAQSRMRFFKEWLLKAVDYNVPEALWCIEKHPASYTAIRNVTRVTLWPAGIDWILQSISKNKLHDFTRAPFDHANFKEALATYGIETETSSGWSIQTLSYLNSSEYVRCKSWMDQHKLNPQAGWYYLQNMNSHALARALEDDPDPTMDNGSITVWPELTNRLNTFFSLENNWCWEKVLALYGAKLAYQEIPSSVSQSLIDALHIARKDRPHFKYEWLNDHASIEVELWINHPSWMKMTGWERCMALQNSIHPTEALPVNGLLG